MILSVCCTGDAVGYVDWARAADPAWSGYILQGRCARLAGLLTLFRLGAAVSAAGFECVVAGMGVEGRTGDGEEEMDSVLRESPLNSGPSRTPGT